MNRETKAAKSLFVILFF